MAEKKVQEGQALENLDKELEKLFEKSKQEIQQTLTDDLKVSIFDMAESYTTFIG